MTMHPGKILTTKRLPLLVVMIFCFGIALPGCMASYWKPVCRHKAVYAAITAGEDVPVRIARGVTGKATWHAQAQGLIDEKWCWLGVKNGWIVITEQDRFYPIEYYSIEEYLNKNFGAK